MTLSRLLLALGATAGLLWPSASSAVCGSYPIALCLEDGFCVTTQVRASASPDEDRPGRQQVEDPQPVDSAQDTIIGRGDFYSDAAANASADRGLLIAAGGTSAHSPGSDGPPPQPPRGASASATSMAVLRAPDLVFSGPADKVATTLRLALDGSFSADASGPDDAESLASVRLDISGAICRQDLDIAFEGARQFTAFDDDNDDPATFEYGTSRGVLDNIPLDIETELVVGPFQVPTGKTLQFELRIANSMGAVTGSGLGSVDSEFVVKLGGLSNGAVFDLPPGYTANSPTVGIVNNSAPGVSGPAACSPVCTNADGKDDLLVKKVAKLKSALALDVDLVSDGSFTASDGTTDLAGTWTAKNARKYTLDLDAPSLEAWLVALEARATAKKGKPVNLEPAGAPSLKLKLNKKGTKASLKLKLDVNGQLDGGTTRSGKYGFKLKGPAN